MREREDLENRGYFLGKTTKGERELKKGERRGDSVSWRGSGVSITEQRGEGAQEFLVHFC